MKYEVEVKRTVSLNISDSEIANSELKALDFMNTMEVAKGLIEDSGDADEFMDYIRNKYQLDIPYLEFNKYPSLLLYALAEVTRCLCMKDTKVEFRPDVIHKFKKRSDEILNIVKEDKLDIFVKCNLPGSNYELYEILLEDCICSGKTMFFLPLMRRLSEEVVNAIKVMI